MNKKLKEQSNKIFSDLKNKTKSEIFKTADMNTPDSFFLADDAIKNLPEQEMIRKKTKKSNIKDLVGNKKMDLPIGKLFSMKSNLKNENKEIDEKWSEKYKKSIDCKNPKGFSQRAHCQGKKKKEMGEEKKENLEATGAGAAGGYSAPLFSSTKGDIIKRKIKEEKLKGGRGDKKTFEDLVNKYKKHGTNLSEVEKQLKFQLNKGVKVEMEHTKDKVKAKEIAMDHLFEDPKYYDKLKKMETKEATSSSSSGQYATPAMWAKTMNKKDWRGASKTQIPGGKFVQVKKKCKKFPYCNQGDIKALNIFENEKIQKIIKNISKKYNINENVIKTILSYEYESKK